MPKLVSVNVGLSREVPWRGRTVKTAIFKSPVQKPVHVGRLALEGDQQADPRYHGGPDKAVYAYPSEHYAFWRAELSLDDLPWGAFGENLTTEGLLETAVRVGDRLRIGSAEFIVTKPRTPCFKLGIRFGRSDVVRKFQKSARSGFYMSVSLEGRIAAGDPIALTSRAIEDRSIADVFMAAG